MGTLLDILWLLAVPTLLLYLLVASILEARYMKREEGLLEKEFEDSMLRTYAPLTVANEEGEEEEND